MQKILKESVFSEVSQQFKLPIDYKSTYPQINYYSLSNVKFIYKPYLTIKDVFSFKFADNFSVG